MSHSYDQRTAKRLVKARKLSLVLDIDHTLLHAVADPRAAALLQSGRFPEMHVIRLRGTDGRPHYVKLRPFLREFLRRAAEICELSIYTHGTRPYAEAVAELLDKDKRLFASRIVSRTDCPELGVSKKSLQRLFPCDDSMVLVVDDTAVVWQGAVGFWFCFLLFAFCFLLFAFCFLLFALLLSSSSSSPPSKRETLGPRSAT